MTNQHIDSAEDTWQLAGQGLSVSGDSPVTGTVAEISTTEDVLGLLDSAPEDLIILMHTSGGTILSPLFNDIKGIVSTTGSSGSHVAILSREFGVPCIMGIELNTHELAGRTVRMQPNGEIHVVVS
jgi:phosphohistidine swiveling domain-containing protein